MALPPRIGVARSRLQVAWCALALLTLLIVGCAIMNRYVFISKNQIPATPASRNIPYQEIWFPARDGVQLNGWLVPGAPGRRLVLFFHGNAGDLADNLEYLNLLHSRGLSVFIFDYRGYGRSHGGTHRENDLYQDARGAIAYLERRGWRHGDLIFFGQSLGSAVALQMALETPPAGLVMEGSFTSMKEIVKHVSPLAYYTVGWWGMSLHFDNLAKIGRCQVPLLLIHGDRDAVVPMEMTMQLFAKARPPKALHIIRGGGHCDVFLRDFPAYLSVWDSYLASLSATHPTVVGVSP